MPTTVLENEEFFKRLTELCESTHQNDHGSIFLTQKRLSYGQDVDQENGANDNHGDLPDTNATKPLPVLMRATNGMPKEKRGDKIKLSTIVQPDELGNFFAKYQDICKNGFQGLKKRDRSARKKAAKAKKKKDTEATKTS